MTTNLRDQRALARLLLEPGRLATESLARWHGERIAVEVIDRVTALSDDAPRPGIGLADRPSPPVLAELLQLSRPTMLQHRSVRLSTSRGTVGVAYSAVVLSRIAGEERLLLARTTGSLGRTLQPRGLRRTFVSIDVENENEPDRSTVVTRTLLHRGPTILGYVHERFYARPEGW